VTIVVVVVVVVVYVYCRANEALPNGFHQQLGTLISTVLSAHRLCVAFQIFNVCKSDFCIMCCQ
jgi:hypothetical protein